MAHRAYPARCCRGSDLSPSSNSEVAYPFEPRLLLDDPVRMARLLAAARSQSGGMSPRRLEGPGASTSGSLTPRIAQASGGALPHMQASLTIGGGSSSGGSAPGTPRFVLSWLAAPGSEATGAAGNGSGGKELATTMDAVRGSAAGKDSATAALPKNSSPSKTGKTSAAQVEQSSGNLVFAPQAKVCPKGTNEASAARRGALAVACEEFCLQAPLLMAQAGLRNLRVHPRTSYMPNLPTLLS